jgi:hypothetical protein
MAKALPTELHTCIAPICIGRPGILHEESLASVDRGTGFVAMSRLATVAGMPGGARPGPETIKNDPK